ncbi:MAG: peptidase [Aeromicrobium sp.]|nr:peptidase [Aeromicrobium sp.]
MTLTNLDIPRTPDAWADFLQQRSDTELARVRAAIDELKDGTPRDAQAVLDLWNVTDTAWLNAQSVCWTLAEVHPDEAVRSLAETLSQEGTKVSTERGLDRDLFAVMSSVDPAGLDAVSTRLLERVLRDFRRSGVDRSDEVRERLRAISERTTVISQDFSRAIRDDVRSIKITPDRLAGLPEDYIAEHPADPDGLVTITTDYPDYIPFSTYATDAAARLALTVESLNRAWPGNDALLSELLDLRHQQATLLGYGGWPDFDAEEKMIGTGDAIATFIDRITEAADAPGRRDLDVLLKRARVDDPTIERLTRADSTFYCEVVAREDYAVDAQEVRRYFDFSKVHAGLLEVTGRIFGIDYVAVPDAATWHADVTVFDVLVDGEPRGRIFLDLHPREGKYKHAAQFDVVTGVEGVQLPEGSLVCNFPRGLMEHDDVVTLFHEFGHLVHHVLGGRQRYARFSGVATEWDFVEAPSQMLEEWAWDTDVLQSFATDADGEPIPTRLVESMREAEEFGKALFARTQMFYASVSYHFHQDRPADLTATVRELQSRYDLLAHIDGSHFQVAFGHLDGYSSAYYTYMWSLVIAKDMFSAFDRDNLWEPTVAHRYRDKVLAQGGNADAADLVADFLGRPYSFDAFGAWLSS